MVLHHANKPDVTETGRIRVLNGSGVGYCLRTPGSTVMTVFVTLRPCAATGVLPVDQQWTFYTDTGDYATIYRIKNPDPLTNMTEG